MKADPAIPTYDPDRPVGERIREELRLRRQVDPGVRAKLATEQQGIEQRRAQMEAEIRSQRRYGAQAFMAEEKTNPASAAETAKLARRFGLPGAVIAASPEIWRDKAKREDAASGMAVSNKLPQWTAQERVRAAIITDDIDNLLRVEQALSPENRASLNRRAAQRAEIEKVLRDPAKATEGGNLFSSVFSLIGADTLSAEQEDATLLGGVRSIGGGFVNTLDVVYNSLAAQMADAFGAITGSESAKADALRISGINERIAILQAARKPEYSYIGGMVYDGFNSLALMAPGLAASIATRSSRPALASAFVLTQPEAYTRYRARGGTPGEAFLGSVLEGTAEVAFEKLPLGVLVNRFGKEGTAQWIGEYLVKEGLTEQATTFTQDFIDTAIANPDKTWGEFWAERPEAALRTLVATGVSSGTLGAVNTTINVVAGRMAQRQSRADAGLATAQFTEDLHKLAQASKVRGRDTETFESWVREAADGTDAEAVYVDAKTLVEVLEQSGLDQDQIMQELPSLMETLPDAIAVEGDVRIPIEEFAARAEKLGPPLIPHLRIDPNDMSKAEAETYMQGAQETMKAEAEALVSAASNADEFRASAERVRMSVAEQLTATGRFTSDVNEAYASLHANFFARLAQRLGSTPEEMAARYPLVIQNDPAERPVVLDQRDDPKPVLNIGLKIDRTGETMAPARAIAALEAVGVKLTRQELRQSNTEQTLIAELDRPLTPEEAAQVSETLEQDAIAQRVGGAGELYGPKAADWGPFNPDYFLDFALRYPDVAEQSQLTVAQLEALAETIRRVRANSYVSDVVRAEDGKLLFVVDDPRDLGPAEREVSALDLDAEAVTSSDPRVAGAEPVLLKRPPVDKEGYITLQHFSSKDDISVLDPTRWGQSGRFLPPSERAGIGTAPPRTYFGIGTGQPGGYINEFGAGAARYEARIKAEELYDAKGDPDGLKRGGKFSESAVAEAGYKGYWSNDPSLGLVAVVFHPTEVRQVSRKGEVYNQDAPIFYSALARAVETSKQAKAPAGQWKGILQNAPGVKAEELEWTGLLDMLDFDPQRVLAREELAEAVAQGGVVVDEVVLGEERVDTESDRDDFIEAYVEDRFPEEMDERLEAQGISAEVVRVVDYNHLDMFDGTSPIYKDGWFFNTSNGDQHGPFEDKETAEAEAEQWVEDQRETFMREEEDNIREYLAENAIEAWEYEVDERRRDSERAPQFQSWSSDESNETYRELLMTLPIGEGSNPKRAPSTHWDQPNVVAHVRFMDKRDADNRRVLFVEEVQSDWHQKGRDQGYEAKVDPKAVEAAQAKFDAAIAAMENKAAEFIPALAEVAGQDFSALITQNAAQTFPNFSAARDALRLYLARLQDGADVEGRIASAAVDEAGERSSEEMAAVLRDLYRAVRLRNFVDATYWERSNNAQQMAQANIALRNFSFFTDQETATALEREVDTELGGPGQPLAEALRLYSDVNGLWEAQRLAGRELDVAKGLLTNGGVPNAPFKTTWPALVMKRVIRWAVDNGYEKIAWTTGAQQAERYNLSEAVGGEIAISPYGDGRVVFSFPEAVSTANTLAENGAGELVSGTEIEGRSRGYPGVVMTREQAVTAMGTFGGSAFDIGLEGPDVIDADQSIRIGGEGMKAFYDRNLVNITNGLVKKYGAKVGGVAITEFGGKSGTNQVFEELARVKAEARAAIGPTEAPNGWTSAAVEERMAKWSVEALGQRVAATRAEHQRNIDQLTRALTERSGPDFIEEAVPGYEAALAERQRKLAVLEEMVSSGEMEQMRAERLALLTDFRDRLRAAETAETPPDKATNLGFEITPELAKAASHGFPLFQRTGAPRGQISFEADITKTASVITLLRGADLSTFLHESGHFFFEVMVDVAKMPDPPQDVLDDLQTMFNWTGVKDLTQWRQMTNNEKREHHERFARAFEAYLFEGRAPSIEMQSLFGKFRSWLLNVYKSLVNLNVNLTDEVRGVFDRMLASETQIAEAQAMAGMEPVYTAKPEGMSDEDWARYQAAHMDATREAVEDLERRSLRDMRLTGNAAARELKRLQREVKARRQAMRKEVEAEIEALPVYRAERFFRRGTLDGQQVENTVKLSMSDLERRYEGKPELLEAAKRRMGTGRYGMLAKEGMTLDEAAETFGFTSGDHFLDAYLGAQKMSEAVETEIDTRMAERYGDLNSPEALRDAVDRALHNDVRGRFVATEYAMLAKAPGKPRVLAAAAREVAKGMIARLRVRDVRPAQHEAAERRSAKAALDAAKKNDTAGAAAHKRSQLVSFYAAKQAREALDEVDKTLRYFGKFSKEATRKNLDPSYRDQIDALLERFDLRVSTTNKEADRRASLLQWVERQREMGLEPIIDEELLDAARRVPYRELTVEQLRGLRDAIRNIEHLARLKKKLLTAKDQRDFAEIVEDVANSIEENAFKTVPETIGAKSWAERISSGVNDFFAWHRKLANFAHVMDGNKYGGAVWERFVRVMNERGDWQAVQNEKATIALGELFKRYEGVDLTTREFVPEVGASLSREDRLMVALNLGNEDNIQRLMDGDKWEQPQLNAVLAPLTREDWQFVQETWDYIDSFWPEIRAKELRVTGLAPEKVEAKAFERQLADGSMISLRGGYFPIKYDPDRSSKAEADTAAEVLQQMTRGLYTAASTRRGHTKARAEKVERPVRKDFGVIFEHVNQVIHDLAWHEYLIDANRLLRAAPIDAAIREGYGPETLRWMRRALEDIAIGDIPAQSAFERGINHLRAGVSIAGMGWNLWTSLLQPLGLTQSASRIGIKWVARGAGRLLGDATKLENGAAWVFERSDMMRLRSKTFQREINEIRNQVGDKSPIRKAVEQVVPGPVAQAVTDSYFVLLTKAQLMADLPTWIGQYEKSMEAGETEERAAALADQAVLDSQGGGQIKDLAAVQRGGPLLKLFTNFYSYFNVTHNLLADRTAQFKRVGAADLPYFAVDALLLTFIPSTLTTLMFTALRGDDEDWETEKLVKAIAKDNLNYMMGLMIGVREIGGAVTGDAGYRGPAGARFFAEMGNLGKQISQGEIDEAMLRSLNNTAGIVFHYPAGQVDRTVRGSMALAEGEAGPLAPLVGPPVER